MGLRSRRLPVVLRYLPVDGVGGVVSRTAYVGREFRGHDGEPDSGRFGNYFSHILVGAGEGDGGFDGLMPIELWGASHWTATESQATDLPPLERIEPGPIDLEAVLARAPASGRRRWGLCSTPVSTLSSADRGWSGSSRT